MGGLSSLTGGGGMSGGAGGSASTGDAKGGYASLDNSGWVVNFGNGSVTSARNDALGQYVPYVVLALAAVVAFKLIRK